MTFQKICIVGPGAVGGMIAVKLAEAGHEVCALARPRKADAINHSGLTLRSGGQVSTVRIKAAATADLLGPQDLVVVALKGDALADVARDLPLLLGPKTPLVFAMNGLPWWFFEGFGGALAGTRLDSLDPDGVLAAQIPLDRLIWGVVNFSVSALDDGSIDHTNNRHLAFGRPNNDPAGLDAICAVFDRAGYVCEISGNIRRDIWAKLGVNSTMSPISSLTLATITQMYHEPLVRETMAAVLAELRAVGVKLGIDPGEYPLERMKDAKVRTSMLQDLERGRPLELTTIIEAAVEVAVRAEVPVPLTRALLGMIRLRARTAGLLS